MLEFKTPEISKISEILKSIFLICGKKGIEFNCIMEGEVNEVTFDGEKKILTFNLPDLKEKNLIENLIHWEEKIKATL
jgi:hypothetical protein